MSCRLDPSLWRTGWARRWWRSTGAVWGEGGERNYSCSTEIQNNGTFYTDANGRQMMQRRRGERSQGLKERMVGIGVLQA